MEELFSQEIEKNCLPALRRQADELRQDPWEGFPGWRPLLILINAILFGSLGWLNVFIIRPVEFAFRLR